MDLVTFTEEILNEKLHFLCIVLCSEIVSQHLDFFFVLQTVFSQNIYLWLPLQWPVLKTFVCNKTFAFSLVIAFMILLYFCYI